MVTTAERILDRALKSSQAIQGQEVIHRELSQIIRYRGLEMTHPSNVANHQRLVTTFAFAAIPWVEDMGLYVDMKPSTVIRLAGYHDDHEADPEVGDTPASEKDKMTVEETGRLKHLEKQAHKRIASELYGFDQWSFEFQQYMQDKHDLDTLSTPEAEMTKIGDTLHAIWEVLHECIAGNESFYPVLDRYKKVSARLEERSPIWKVLKDHPALQLDQDRFPTPAIIRNMPKVSKEFVTEVNAESYDSWNRFIQGMHNPTYPAWYRRGVDLTLLTFGHTEAARVMFPKWRESFYSIEIV